MDTSINNKLIEIKEIFSMFQDPLDMMAQLIDIGKGAHILSDEEKVNANLIPGCTCGGVFIGRS